MKKLSIIALLLVIATLFSGCNVTFGQKENKESNNTVSEEKFEIVQSGSVDFYRPDPVDEVKLADSFTDGRYNYYYYYLGDIENFPLIKSEVANHTGSKFNYEQSLSSEKQQSIENSVARCVTTTVSRNWQHSIEIGVTLGNDSFCAGNGGFSFSWGGETSTSNSLETTHTVAEAWANSTTNTFCFSLAKDDPHGYYRYVKYAKECKVFAVAIYDTQAEKKTEIIDNFTFTYVTFVDETQSPYVVMEYSASENFESDKDSDIAAKLKFDENIVVRLDLDAKLPNASKSINSIDIPVKKHLCKTDAKYDPYSNGNSSNGKVHDGYEIGHITIRGCSEIGDDKDTFTIENSDAFSIEYVFEQDAHSLPKHEGRGTWIADDEASLVKGTDIVSQKIKMGAYQVTIVRENQKEEKLAPHVDFMRAKMPGDRVSLLEGVTNPETIKEIRVTIVYEIYCGTWFGNATWTNWRSDYVFTFQ